ncbi:hypothetical protein [Salinicoccus roseus]|uniref:Uncharacterized protein n=1 Tax=Salinicoccus roseus TaxID=45670 RepID=A0A265E864_9STAP|nr:hypothetical protein [Salinicoccus roseus]OZT77779.1 hypothetical protein CFN03_00365 [Salinicoccus roseus]
MSKKILYNDLQLLKSVSAQLYKGNLVEKGISQGETSSERTQDAYGTKESNSETFSAKFNAVVGAGLDGGNSKTTEESKEIEESSIESFQESKKIAYDEYLINLVQESLSENDELKSLEQSHQYDYVKFSRRYYFFDFDLMKNSIDYKYLVPLALGEGAKLKDYDDLLAQYKVAKKYDNKKETAENMEHKQFSTAYKDTEIFKSMTKISSHLDNILRNHFLLIDSEKETLVIGDKNELKLPPIALTLNESMDLNIFGLVISNDDQVITDDLGGSAHLNPESIMRKIGKFALENYLIHFFEFENRSKYKIIHPISIEYSAN